MDRENLNELYFDYDLGETVVVKNVEEISKDLLKHILERSLKHRDFKFPFGKKLIVYSRNYLDIVGTESGSYTYVLVDEEGNVFCSVPQSALYPYDEEESN